MGQGQELPVGYGSTILLNTVAENKAKYTVDDYQRAVKARTIQQRIGRPSTKRYSELANKGCILNCDVTRQDIATGGLLETWRSEEVERPEALAKRVRCR
mgnify:CR=1 FL=1